MLGRLISSIALLLVFATMHPAIAETAPSKPSDFVSPFKHERVLMNLDLHWHLANRLQQENRVLLQYLPEGENAKDVHTMINLCTYRGLEVKMNARGFMKQTKKTAEVLGEKGKFEWKVVKDDEPGDVIFEYTVKGHPTVQDQFEMQRLISGKDGIHAIIYHTRNTQVTPAQHEEMLKILKGVIVAPAV